MEYTYIPTGLHEIKIAAGDMVSIRGQVMEYIYIPTGIKREMVIWCGLRLEGVSLRDCWKRTGGHSF